MPVEQTRVDEGLEGAVPVVDRDEDRVALDNDVGIAVPVDVARPDVIGQRERPGDGGVAERERAARTRRDVLAVDEPARESRQGNQIGLTVEVEVVDEDVAHAEPGTDDAERARLLAVAQSAHEHVAHVRGRGEPARGRRAADRRVGPRARAPAVPAEVERRLHPRHQFFSQIPRRVDDRGFRHRDDGFAREDVPLHGVDDVACRARLAHLDPTRHAPGPRRVLGPAVRQRVARRVHKPVLAVAVPGVVGGEFGEDLVEGQAPGEPAEDAGPVATGDIHRGLGRHRALAQNQHRRARAEIDPRDARRRADCDLPGSGIDHQDRPRRGRGRAGEPGRGEDGRRREAAGRGRRESKTSEGTHVHTPARDGG